MTTRREELALSPATWVKLLLSMMFSVGTPVIILQGRLTTVEANQTAMQRQIDANNLRSTADRQEILAEIKGLRQEIRARK